MQNLAPLLFTLALFAPPTAATKQLKDLDCINALVPLPISRAVFTRAWTALGGRDAGEVWNDLVERYAEDDRAYHTLDHIQSCLELMDEYLADHPEHAWMRDPMLIAFWFHDAVYDSHAMTGNERASADLFLVSAQNGFDRAANFTIERLIMATETHLPQTDLDRLFVDIDLAILGSSPKRFAQFEREIRTEYAWVPRDAYVVKRREVLKRFLGREPLYRTAYFRRRFEAQAKTNLLGATSASPGS